MNKGKVDVLLGLQWGDEGKGKVAIKYANTGGAGGVLYELAVLGANAQFVRVDSGNEALFAVTGKV